MNNIDLGYRLKELVVEVKGLTVEVQRLTKKSGADGLWDNADMIRNWKVSARTLATWRAEGLIGYVQLGSKIWYPREARELFLNSNFVKTKEGGIDDGERS